MAVDVPVLREAVQRVFTRNEVLDACKRRDLGAVIAALSAQGVTQGQLSVLTGIPQGRLSEYKTHKRTPTANSTFEAFADGLGMPPAARRALGLDPEATGSSLPCPSGVRVPDDGGSAAGNIQPVLSTLSQAGAIPVLSALREIHRGYLRLPRGRSADGIVVPQRSCHAADAGRGKSL